MKKNQIILLILAGVVIVAGVIVYFVIESGKYSSSALSVLDNQAIRFPDVDVTDPAYNEIEAVAARGWMQGYPDGNFYPDQSATRAEIAVAIYRAANSYSVGGEADSSCDLNDPSTWIFTDVACDHWAYSELKGAKNLKLISGYEDGSFRPEQIATRAEMTVVLVRGAKLTYPPKFACENTSPIFTDVTCDYWAYNYIRVAQDNKVVQGYEDGSFQPDTQATRRDLAVVIHRAWIRGIKNGRVSGRVLGTKSMPVAGAVVTYCQGPTCSSESVTTKSNGKYEFSLYPGYYSIRAKKADEGAREFVYIIGSQGETLDLRLSKYIPI